MSLIHLKSGDPHFLLRGAIPSPEVVLVTIDQKTLDTIPDLEVFWHPYYARAIRAAAGAGARVFGLDVTFPVPVGKWEPDHDRILAEAVSEAASRMPVICGYVPGTLENQARWPVPVNIVAAVLDLAAYTNLTIDPDDFVRRQELLEAPRPGYPPARSLPLRMAEKYLGQEARFSGGSLFLGNTRLPVDRNRALVINFSGPPGTVERVSLTDFLSAGRDRLQQWVRGKAVLLGPDDKVRDRHATPFYAALAANRWNTAGVEIHAGTLSTILQRRFIIPAPVWLRTLALLVCSAVAVWLATAAGARGVLSLLALFASLVAAAHLLFRAGVMIAVSELALASVLALLAGSVYRFLRAERTGGFMQYALGLFTSRKLASALVESGTLSLTASREFVTILFSDIRGFTAFCENKDPEVVVASLNDYMAAMVNIVTSHGGHVNKFLGDGILAVFSDDDGSVGDDHVLRAVRCGEAMVRGSDKFSTGVGIHSGLVVIGNVGSAQKMEYTVLGDAVNVASRIEGMNKESHTRLLMSVATRELLDLRMETVHIGSVAIRGLSVPMDLYTLASLAQA